MTGKRKRVHCSAQDRGDEPRKYLKADVDQKPTSHPTLALYYNQISTLREYVLSRLPKASRARRRKILSMDSGYLDKTLICPMSVEQPRSDSSRSEDFETFSQQTSLSASSSVRERTPSQSDLINFAIWLLFHRIYRHVHKPPHMLCHGYYRAHNSKLIVENHGVLAAIPGIVSHYPNNNVEILKNAFWTNLLDVLGKGGDGIMLDLILECGLFVAVDKGQGNYFQLSGLPHRNVSETELMGLSRNSHDRNASSGEYGFVKSVEATKKRCQPRIQTKDRPTMYLSYPCCDRVCP